MIVDQKRIIEGLLFMAEGPLSLEQMAQLLETQDRQSLSNLLQELQAEYESQQRAFVLVEVAGGYAFRTRPELSFWLRRLRREQVTRLSRAALETLAIVAYKQPIMKAEIERLRGGIDAGGVLRLLMEKDLVRALGRRDLPGRPLIYGTTKRFLEVFDLKSISDLPSLEEMAALSSGLEADLPEAPEQHTLPLGAGAQDGPDTPFMPEDEEFSRFEAQSRALSPEEQEDSAQTGADLPGWPPAEDEDQAEPAEPEAEAESEFP